MNEKIVFVRTSSGEDEVRSRTAHLSNDIKRALLMVDGTASVAEIMKRSSPSLRSMLQDMLLELLRGGFIRDQSKTPLKVAPVGLKKSSEVDELDFTAAYRAPTQAMLDAEAAKLALKPTVSAENDNRTSLEFLSIPASATSSGNPVSGVSITSESAVTAEIDAKAKLLAEEHARLEAEVSRLRTQAAAEIQARSAAEAQAKIDADAAQVAKAEAARLARAAAQEEARIARFKAEQEAEHQAVKAKLQEEIEAARQAEQAQRLSEAREAALQRTRLEAEVAALKVQAENEARVHAAAEQQAKAAEVRAAQLAHEEAEAIRLEILQRAEQLKLETEARARAATEESARLAAEVVKLKEQAEIEAQKREQVRVEVEAARLKAQQEAEKARLQAQQEAQARAAEAASRVKAEQEAERIRQEAEQARLRAAAESEARTQAERFAKEAETARLFAQQEASRIQAEAEARVLAAEAAALKIKQEAEQAAREAVERAHHAAQLRAHEEAASLRKAQEEILTGRHEGQAGHITGSFAGFDLAAFDLATLPLPSVAPHPVEEPIHRPSIADQLLQDAIGLRDAEAVTFVQQTDLKPAESAPVLLEPSISALLAAERPVVEPAVEPAEAIFSEAETKQQAEVQAKKWAEAEQRASEQAKKAAIQVSSEVSQPPVGETATVIRVRRKPFAWGRWLSGLAALLVAALFIIPLLLPMQDYAHQLEQVLTRQLQQTVHIGRLTGRILPMPQLVLKDVTVGSENTLKVNQVQVDFAFSALLASVKPVTHLILDGLQLDGRALPDLSGWLQQLAVDRQYPVAQIALSNSQLDASGLPFTDIDGLLDFDTAGKLVQARLGANGHKLGVEFSATPEQKMLLTFTLHDSALPWLPNWTFDELKASGELSRDEVRITALEGRILGGMLTGNARINWRSGWRAQGALAGKIIPLQNLNKLLNGDLDGSAQFQMQADSLSKLANATILNGTFTVQKGVINGLDVVETTRLRSRESLSGGRTHFDKLSGELSFANEIYQFRQLKLSDNVVRATGSCNVNKQQLSGILSANLTLRAGMGGATLQLGGTTASPTLHVEN